MFPKDSVIGSSLFISPTTSQEDSDDKQSGAERGSTHGGLYVPRCTDTA
jgi:hypothetical protein